MATGATVVVAGDVGGSVGRVVEAAIDGDEAVPAAVGGTVVAGGGPAALLLQAAMTSATGTTTTAIERQRAGRAGTSWNWCTRSRLSSGGPRRRHRGAPLPASLRPRA